MNDDAQGRERKRRRIALLLAAVIGILAALLVPPWISISRYKSSITRLISNSLGRPVRLSSVQLRLLPWPGFVLTDLTVAEDPAYGAEPVLHANTVTASIRLTSLWRGHMEISRISVDEASLNVVRASPGHWNLNSLLRTATAHSSTPGSAAHLTARLPYLEATNSRVNIKDGAEKLPFSLLNTDLSFWQEDSGLWRVRLRGQPARTDVGLDMGDTGVVRLEASMQRARALDQMPIHVDLDWREAQFGQLARLLTGSDTGWRGDLAAELHLDGTPDSALVKTRLRATGVHRAEFAPADPLDFDANCAFVYHHYRRAVDNLVCDSPLGNGLVHLTGELPGDGAPPQLAFELERVPVAAGLGVLRTVRNGIASDLEVQGTVSGKLAYAQSPVQNQPQRPRIRSGIPSQSGAAPSIRRDPGPDETGALGERSILDGMRGQGLVHAVVKGKRGRKPSRSSRLSQPSQGPLTGILTVDGFSLSGAGLSQPLHVPKFVLTPSLPSATAASQALTGTVAVAAGAPTPLTISMRLAQDGYEATVRGQAPIKWARDLAQISSIAGSAPLDRLAGDPLTLDLTAQGRWQPAGALVPNAAPVDKLTGTVIVRNANWKADYLANVIQISQATIHLDGTQLRWDPVAFTYGPVKGTATVTFPVVCTAQPCASQFQVQFGELDATALEAAFLGAREPNTLLSTLIERLDPAKAPSWPELDGTVKATSLIVGPVTLVQPVATLTIHPDHAEFSSLDAGVLGGHIHAGGSVQWAAAGQSKPAYTLQAKFQQLNPAAVGRVLAETWSGAAFDADGNLALSGFTGPALASTAKGTLHFDWKHGAISITAPAAQPAPVDSADNDAPTPSTPEVSVPPSLARFDDWTADAAIANGTLTLTRNTVVSGTHKRAIEGTITLGDPPKVHFAMPKSMPPKKQPIE